jgi:hypothetical protein
MNIKSFDVFNESKLGKGPKGKDLTTFIRYGGLDLKRQDGYGSTTFHAPPSPRGIYAFPKTMQELFLVGSIDKFQPGTYPKVPEYPGNDASQEELEKFHKDSDAFDWDEYDKKRKKIFHNIRKEFKKTSGNVWHHLGEYCKNVDIIDRHNSWVKTDIATWQKSFSKASLTDRYGEDFGGSEGRGEHSINTARGLTGMYSKDRYEVFFDEKV